MASPLLVTAPYRALATRIAERLVAGRQGAGFFTPWSEEVIVASSGMADSIAAEVMQRVPAGVAGLGLQSLETLARRVLNAAGQYPRVAGEAERRLAMRHAARALSDPLLQTRGAASMLERTHRDVRDSGVAVADFSRRVGRVHLRNRERSRTAAAAWQRYESLISQLGAIDPADLLLRAAALIRDGADIAPQLVAGFYDMTGAQLVMIDALRESRKLSGVFVPVDPGHPRLFAFADTFAGRFGPLPDAAAAASAVTQTQWSVSGFATREEEIAGCCQTLADLLGSGVPPGRIAVTARSLEPYDLHLFERFAAQHGFRFAASPELPLISHRFGRAVHLLLRIRERGFPRADVLEIARSGLRLRTRIDAEQADQETRRAHIAGGTSTDLRSRGDANQALRSYVDLVAEIEGLLDTASPRWLGELVERFRVESRTDLSAIEALTAIGELWSRAAAWKEPVDSASLIDAIEGATLPPSPPSGDARPLVWIGDVMRLRGRSFEHLLAVRMQDGLLPQRRIEDPLLPDSDRSSLGIRQIGDGRSEEQLLFRLLSEAATTAIRFSFAASDGFGKPLRASQFLKQHAIEREPEARQEVLEDFTRWCSSRWPHAGRPPSTPRTERPGRLHRSLQLLTRSGSRGPFDGYVTDPAVVTRALAALTSASPTQLEDFGECPQKFFWKHVLRVRDIDDPEQEVQINVRDKGTLDHRILERFYRATSRNDLAETAAALPRLPRFITDRLHSLVDEEFDILEETAPPFNPAMRRIERQATKRNLAEFIAGDFADLFSADLWPARFEYRFGSRFRETADQAEAFVVDAGGVALRVEGMIDRIDEGASGLRVVDYKSGKALRHRDLGKKIDRGVRLQLPLYALAVAHFFSLAPEQVSAAIKPVGGRVNPDHFAFELGEKEAELRETLTIFARAVGQGRFPAFPNEKDTEFNSCKYCPVSHSCRTRHDADEKRGILRFGEPRSMLREEA